MLLLPLFMSSFFVFSLVLLPKSLGFEFVPVALEILEPTEILAMLIVGNERELTQQPVQEQVPP